MKTFLTLCICLISLLKLSAQVDKKYLTQDWLRIGRYKDGSNFTYAVDTTKYKSIIKFTLDSIIYPSDHDWYACQAWRWKDSTTVELLTEELIEVNGTGASFGGSGKMVVYKEMIIYKLTADLLILGEKGSNGIISKAKYVSNHHYRLEHAYHLTFFNDSMLNWEVKLK